MDLKEDFFEIYHIPTLLLKMKKALLKDGEVNVSNVRISLLSTDHLNGFMELYYENAKKGGCHLLISQKIGMANNHLSVIYYKKSTGESILDLYQMNMMGGWDKEDNTGNYPEVTWAHFFENLPSNIEFPFLNENPKCYYSQHFNQVQVVIDYDVYFKEFPQKMELFLNGLDLDEKQVYLVWVKKTEVFKIHV